MSTLSNEQIRRYQRDVYLMVEYAVTPQQLAALRHDMQRWVEESRAHSENYGQTINHRPRFDLDQVHGRLLVL